VVTLVGLFAIFTQLQTLNVQAMNQAEQPMALEAAVASTKDGS
jgi:hypothetical protein